MKAYLGLCLCFVALCQLVPACRHYPIRRAEKLYAQKRKILCGKKKNFVRTA